MATFQTLKETNDQDIAVEGGDLVLIEDKDVIRQQLESNYRLARRDWFLNLDEGLNFYDGDNGIIGGKGNQEENRADLILTGTDTIGVKELVSITFDVDSAGTLNVPVVFTTVFAPTEEESTNIEI